MRAVIQRVTEASVSIDGCKVSQIGKGLLVLVGAATDDTNDDIKYIVDKTVNLRIFEDENGKMNISAMDKQLDIMVVSQFTLMGDARKGRRPGFSAAGRPEDARKIYELTVKAFEETGLSISTGEFQADMQVSLVNDGPVTILLDSKKLF